MALNSPTSHPEDSETSPEKGGGTVEDYSSSNNIKSIGLVERKKQSSLIRV